MLKNPVTLNIPTAVLARVRSDGYHLEADDCTALLLSQVEPGEIKLLQTIVPDHRHVAEQAADCERILLALGWPEEAATATRLLVMEHAANAVDHGHLPPGSTIFLQMRVCERLAALLFRDHGREWDYDDGVEGARRRAPDDARGRWLNIISNIASHMELFRRGSENIAFYLVSADFDTAKSIGDSLL